MNYFLFIIFSHIYQCGGIYALDEAKKSFKNSIFPVELDYQTTKEWMSSN